MALAPTVPSKPSHFAVHDVATGQVLRQFPSHEPARSPEPNSEIISIQANSAGTKLAAVIGNASSRDQTTYRLRIWDVTTGRQLLTLDRERLGGLLPVSADLSVQAWNDARHAPRLERATCRSRARRQDRVSRRVVGCDRRGSLGTNCQASPQSIVHCHRVLPARWQAAGRWVQRGRRRGTGDPGRAGGPGFGADCSAIERRSAVAERRLVFSPDGRRLAASAGSRRRNCAAARS